MINIWKRDGRNSIKGKIGILFLIGIFTTFSSIDLSGFFNVRIPFPKNMNADEFISYVYVILAIFVIVLAISLVSMLIAAPFNLSKHYVYLKVSRGEKVRFVDAFYGFKDYGSSVKLYFMTNLYIFLWSCLFIVPGVVAGYKYSFAFYHLADNKGASTRDCINRSEEITYGFKKELFALDLSFIGWILLSILTLGILSIWVSPYYQASHASAYIDLSNDDCIEAIAS